MNNVFDAFISYGRRDSKAFATKLYQKLTNLGLRVWFDQNDIPLGVDFQNQIDDGIKRSHNFIFIIAPHSVKSQYCLKEIELAIRLNKRIIPLLHVEPSDCWDKMHPTIGRINWIYFQEDKDDFEASVEGLTKLIQQHSDYVQQHTNFLIKAQEWKKNQKQNNYLLVGEERKQAESWLKRRFRKEQAPCLPTDLHCEFITESTKNGNNLMSQVFLSYSEYNRGVMEKVAKSLRRYGFTVWTNKTDITTGIKFQEEIDYGIEGASNLIYLISPASLESKYCQQEIEYALTLKKRIIPILIAPTELASIPPHIKAIQFVDFTNNKEEAIYNRKLDKLLKVLKEDERYYEDHKVMLIKALKWDRQNRNYSILLRGHNLEYYENWLKVNRKRHNYPPLPLQEEFIEASSEQPAESSLEVFISYSRADADFARKLNEALQVQGKTTWFDQESIPPGSNFQEEIYRGIQNSDNFLFIISPKSVNSPYCADEVEYAQSLNKRFITILHEQVSSSELHPVLRKVQWIDFNQHDGDFYANFSQLVRTIDTDRDYVRSHTKWSQQAFEWEQQDKDKDLLLRGSEFSIAQFWLQEAEQNKRQPTPTNWQKEFINSSREEIEAEEKREKRQQLVLKVLLVLVSAACTASVIFGWQAFKKTKLAEKATKIAEEARHDAEKAKNEAEEARHDAETESERAEIENLKSLSKTSEALFGSQQILDSLIEAIRAGKKLQKDPEHQKDTQDFANNSPLHKSIVTSLFNAVYLVRESNRFDGHKGLIWDVIFSPDGNKIASVSGDNTIKVWRPDGTEIDTLKGHNGQVLGVSFHPDNNMMASASDDQTVKLWKFDGKNYTNVATLEGHKKSVDDVSFSPDGKIIASASEDATVKIWQLDGTLITTINGHNAAVRDVEFSPDGNILASASDDKAVRLWRKDGRWIRTLRGHNARVYGLSFSPDGETLASASWDQTVRLWKLDGRSKLIRAHNRRVFDVDFSADGQTLASASEDKTIKIWKLDGTLKSTLVGHSSQVRGLSFNNNGKMLVSAGGDRTVKLWELEPELIIPLQEHQAQVLDVAFSPNGELLASASADRTVKLWKPDGTLIKTLKRHGDVVRSVSFSPDGKILASASSDRTVRLWTREGKLIRRLDGHGAPVNDVTFSPDGKLIASGSQDRTVIIWKPDGEKFKTLGNSPDGHKEGVLSVRFSPDGKTLASTSWDKTVKLWNVEDGILIETISGHDGWVFDAQFGQQGQTITTASYDNTVKLWNTEGNLLQTLGKSSEAENKNYELENTDGHSDGVIGLSFDKTSETIATTSADKTVKLWSKDGSLITTLKGHTDKVNSVSFSPDGAMLASASDDRKIILWRLKDQDDQYILDLDKLLVRGCDWIQDYLKNNQNLEDSDSLPDNSASRNLCEGDK